MGGWIGGIGGSIIGLIGAAIGLLTGMGKARTFVFGLLSTLIAVGAVSLTGGLVALILKQPYAVWYPLVLCGAITLPLGIFLWVPIRKKFELAELRRMQAMDGG
jgi:hypothetical protein